MMVGLPRAPAAAHSRRILGDRGWTPAERAAAGLARPGVRAGRPVRL